MGTNYYLKQECNAPCEHCDLQPLHIGKSSGGWVFSLHVYPTVEDGQKCIDDLDDWIELFTKNPTGIYDEYDRPVTVLEMMHIITDRHWSDDPDYFKKPMKDGGSWVEFHQQNQSCAGPYGLLRHRVDGRHCIKHGSGTWDLIVGDFS